ncbi:hypothetical protein ABPG72_015735 [Tetrahymena utriculariae]
MQMHLYKLPSFSEEVQQSQCGSNPQTYRSLNDYSNNIEKDSSISSQQCSLTNKTENQRSRNKRQNETSSSKSRENKENYNPNLNNLKLNNQNIKVISGINHYQNLQELDLSHNQILKIQNIDRLYMLTSLNISHNKIQILENIYELQNLQNLNASYNQIKVFPKFLIKNYNLRILNLSHNQIENEDCFNFLNKFVNLKSLDLSENPLAKLQNYQQSILSAIPTLTHFDGQILPQKQLYIYSIYEDKDHLKRTRPSPQLHLISDQQFKNMLINHDKNKKSLGCNLAQMVSDIANSNNGENSKQSLSSQVFSSRSDINSQLVRGSTQSNSAFSKDFQTAKRIPFKELKQSDQKSDSFSYQNQNSTSNNNYYFSNKKLESSSLQFNNLISPITSENKYLDINSNTQLTDIIQISQQHSPRDEININQKREDLANAKIQKSEEMKNQCIEFLEKWDANLSNFNENYNLFLLQNQLFKDWTQNLIVIEGNKCQDIFSNKNLQELIEKVKILTTLTAEIASLMKKEKSDKIEIIKRLEKFLKQPFHPQEITKKAIELLEMTKLSQDQEETTRLQRNCEQVMLVIHNMRQRIFKEIKETKQATLINQIYKNILDQNNLYVSLSKIQQRGKLLSQQIFQKFLLFFKYHIKDSSEDIASIQGNIDLNESLRDLLFSNDDNQINKQIASNSDRGTKNIIKSSQKKINNSTPILQELDAYIHNMTDDDDDIITTKQKLSNTQESISICQGSQLQDVIINSFHHSCSKIDEKEYHQMNSKEKNLCLRCQEANQVMLQQQSKIEELQKEIRSLNTKLQEKQKQISDINSDHEKQLIQVEDKYKQIQLQDEERYLKLKNSLIYEEELFHHLNDQMFQQDTIIEQNKEITQRLSEYNNYMVKFMASKNEDSSEFFKMVLTQQAQSIEKMMASNKSNSQLYLNLLKVVENHTLPQMKLIPKQDATCQTNNIKSNQPDQVNTTFATSPSKGRDIFKSLENNSYSKNNQVKQMLNISPPSQFNSSALNSRKSTPTLDFQKEIQKRKKSKPIDLNQYNNPSKTFQSHLDLENIYISPQRNYQQQQEEEEEEEEEIQKNLYTFSHCHPSSIEKENSSNQNSNKTNSKDSQSQVYYKSKMLSLKKSPNSNDREISFFRSSNNSKIIPTSAFNKNPWKMCQESKKKKISSCAEESQITEIERGDNDKQINQASSQINYNNFVETKDHESYQDFQIQQENKQKQNRQHFSFREVQQFDPFINIRPNKISELQSDMLNNHNFSNSIINSSHTQALNTNRSVSSKKMEAKKSQFVFSSNLQQKIFSTLQKKQQLNQQKTKTVTTPRNQAQVLNSNQAVATDYMLNYKNQYSKSVLNSKKNSNLSNRTSSRNGINQIKQQNDSKTPKKRFSIDLNITPNTNLSNIQSKSTTHQNSNNQTNYFGYYCASTKNSQQPQTNNQKHLQQQYIYMV